MGLASNALTTYATAKAELGLADDSQQATVERYINGASDLIERFCNRQFGQQNAPETLRGPGRTRLMLSRTPVWSVSSVTYDGATIDPSEYVLENAEAGFLYRQNGWQWSALFGGGPSPTPMPGTERQPYVVTYVGGYVLPKDDPTRSTNPSTQGLPFALEQACIEVVVAWYRMRGKNKNITAERIGDASRNYREEPGALPAFVQELLEPFVRAV